MSVPGLKKIKRRFRNLILHLWVALETRRFNLIAAKLVKKAGLRNHAPDHKIIRQHKELWGRLSKNANTDWYRYFSGATGIEDARFVPLGIYYYHIEPVLNNKTMSRAYADKNIYDILYPTIKKPEVYIRFINGYFYDRNYRLIDDKLVNSPSYFSHITDQTKNFFMLKPAVRSGRGRWIQKLSVSNGKLLDSKNNQLTLSALKKQLPSDFIIQEYIEQHECTRQFNPSSLNCIRVFTYRSLNNDRIIPLHYLQKFGKPGGVTDYGANMGFDSSGKYTRAISEGHMRLKDSGKHIPVNNLPPFPFMSEINQVAREVARLELHSRVLGIDLAIDKNGQVLLIEVNNSSIGVNNPQLTGGPLFGDHTEEVIAFCAERKRRFSFVFEF